jgi:hypothetical protein
MWLNAPMPGARFNIGSRRDIAVALNGRERTLYETAKALGLRSGDIQKTVRQMHSEGVLRASDPEPVRGTLFTLREEYVADLDEALRANQAPGVVAPHQTLLLLRAPSKASLDKLLGRADLVAPVSWAARCGSGREMLLAINPQLDVGGVGRLESALEASGVVVETCAVTALMDTQRLRSASLSATNAAGVVA